MDECSIKWCSCKGHDAKDWTDVADFYARHFVPQKWVLDYNTLDCEQGRTLYMTGVCDHCRGFMRSGVGLAMNIGDDQFLTSVYQEMAHFRPYDGHKEETGLYFTCVAQRGRWYQQQDDLTLAERNGQFLRLFRPEHQPIVKEWLARNHAEEPYSKPCRDRKSTLLRRVLEAARADGTIAEAEAILDYILPTDNEPTSPERDSYLTDYRFNVVPSLVFGCEGIFLELRLEGTFDTSDTHVATIETFKTPRADLKACQLMGMLGGALMHYACQYVNQESHRYTPERELLAQQESERCGT